MRSFHVHQGTCHYENRNYTNPLNRGQKNLINKSNILWKIQKLKPLGGLVDGLPWTFLEALEGKMKIEPLKKMLGK